MGQAQSGKRHNAGNFQEIEDAVDLLCDSLTELTDDSEIVNLTLHEILKHFTKDQLKVAGRLIIIKLPDIDFAFEFDGTVLEIEFHRKILPDTVDIGPIMTVDFADPSAPTIEEILAKIKDHGHNSDNHG